MGEPIHIRDRVSFAAMKIHLYKRRSSDKIFHFKKNTELPNAAAVVKWRSILRLAGNVGISDHLGKPKPFSNDCLVTENQKSKADSAIFWIFSEK